MATESDTSRRLRELVRRLDLDDLDDGIDVSSDVRRAIDRADFESLESLEHLPFVTIDNPDSRDLDQALHVEETPRGWLVRYALADAAHFVRSGTALFRRSTRRGATFYFPDFALPMLPPELSEGIVSLNPDVPRRALLFESVVTADGHVEKTDVRRVRIRSAAKLSYEGVQRYFDGEPDDPVSDEPFEESLRAFARAGEARIERARARGMIEFDRSEASVAVSDDGERFELVRRERLDVERWNEQMSLLCNTEGARLLRELGAELDDLFAVYRVHLPPIDRRLSDLEAMIADAAQRHDLDDRWLWKRERSLADYLAGLPAEPARVRTAVERQVRYTNRASEFSDRVGPHFALAVDQYARFSSPMREVVGIFTHKEMLEALGLVDEPDSDDEKLRDQVIDAANQAKHLQKRIDKEVMLFAMDDLFGAELSAPPTRLGTVVGLRPTRLYVLLDDLPIDVKVYREDVEQSFGAEYSLADGVYRPDSDGAPTIGIGDGVAVTVRERRSGRWRFDVRLVRERKER